MNSLALGIASVICAATAITVGFLSSMDFDDEIVFGLTAGREIKWGHTIHLVWAIVFVEALAAICAFCGSVFLWSRPDYPARAIYIAPFPMYAVLCTGLTSIFLLLTGCDDCPTAILISVVISIFPQMLVLIAEEIFAKEAETKRVGWDRTWYANMAWILLFMASFSIFCFEMFLVLRSISFLAIIRKQDLILIPNLSLGFLHFVPFFIIASSRWSNGYMNPHENRMRGVFSVFFITMMNATSVVSLLFTFGRA